MRRAGYMLLLCMAGLCLGPLAGSAVAAPSVESSSLSLSTAQAGAHADATISVALEDPGEPETARDLLVDLPPGYFLYPGFHVRCLDTQLESAECPVDSQVGVVSVRGNFGGDPDSELGTGPVYLLAQEADEVARFAIVLPPFESQVEASVTASPANDHGLELAFDDFPEEVPLQRLDLTLWGVPAAPIHDELRFPIVPGGLPSSQPEVPFLRNPTSCAPGGGLYVEVESYEDPEDFATATGTTPFISGCGKLAFDPAFEVALTSAEAGVPVGLDLTVELPGSLAPQDLSSSDAGEIFIALPPELELDEEALESAASLGSFAADVLGVEAPLEGSVFFDAAESADTYRILLAGSGGGIDLWIPAFLEYDAAFGSWAIELPNLPQLPFETFELQIANAGGPFFAPRCGDFEAISAAAPWSENSIRLAHHTLRLSSGPGGSPCPVPGQKTAPPSSLPPPAVTPLPPAKPVVTFRRHPPKQTRDRTPTFRFVSNVAGSTFECRIDGRRLRRCKSPLTLPRLGFGRHAFKVRTVAPGGIKSLFATYKFAVRR